MYRAEVRVELKDGVTDPEGANALKALELLGFGNVRRVRAVKSYNIDLDASDEGDARSQAEEMVRRLLANPVIHDYAITVEKV